tara:strand:+ start:158 stop:1036 length:879 start_codon:yes stop_codon:yes gene_type:complete
MDNSIHLAGIVPVAGQAKDFNMPWHDALMPIAQGYLAIEKAVINCASAGCETIWIVCHKDTMPLIKKRIGDYVEDPVYAYRRFEKFPSMSRRRLPVYYVAIHPNDRDKRDCLGWSALYGIKVATGFASSVSHWLSPEKFFVSFPYGIVPDEALLDNREIISHGKSFSFSYGDKTVCENEYLPFSIDYEECCRLTEQLQLNGTGRYTDNQWWDRKRALPLEERYSARFFTLAQVFEGLNFSDTIETSYYFNIDNWEDYLYYMSNKPEDIKRPPKRILAPGRKLHGIAKEDEDE